MQNESHRNVPLIKIYSLIQDHSDCGAFNRGTEESLPRVDSSVLLMHHDLSDLQD